MQQDAGYLVGKLLVAMPGMGDPRFERSVIYICAHSAEGAMGLVINKMIDHVTFSELLDQLDIPCPDPTADDIRVHFGGPVETGRGFVLHSADYGNETTWRISSAIAITATVEILRSIARGRGPNRSLLALGYAGWSSGQLENEIRGNGWLHANADEDLLFGRNQDEKWTRAIARMGIDLDMLSGVAGHA